MATGGITWAPPGRGPLHPAAFWPAIEQPLGLLGLDRLSVAVRDLEAAVERIEAVVGATIVGRGERPVRGGHGGGAPQLETPCSRSLRRPARGPKRSTSIATANGSEAPSSNALDLGRVKQQLGTYGIDVVPGDRDGTVAIPARAEPQFAL